MRLNVFLKFVEELREAGMRDSRHVTMEEKAAIFLYMSVTGLRIRHAGERFQRSKDTISKYFLQVLTTVSSNPFYSHPSASLTEPGVHRQHERFAEAKQHASDTCQTPKYKAYVPMPIYV
jgi:transposase